MNFSNNFENDHFTATKHFFDCLRLSLCSAAVDGSFRNDLEVDVHHKIILKKKQLSQIFVLRFLCQKKQSFRYI